MFALLQAAEESPGFFENTWPEEFRFPFGEWIKQLVFWAVNHPFTSAVGDAVEWPFNQFFELIMSEQVGRDSITTVPWPWLVIAVFVVASFTRNTRIGLACAMMLAACGFLGSQYWEETAKTIGMILVSVTLCALVGIPLGIISGRVDAVWNVVRPTLDAMQVVHSFVFMLPFIFFFGIGEVSATMVTMVFALPPLVRLTNLGIRQVPEDVVEAARSYGATEMRVLKDVQLPLARPAIMTGLNQTLLLAISMLGIAALMGAGGLGKLLFRAINNLNLGLAASAGLAFFLVAVVLDRISQTESQDGMSLLARIRQAYEYRADPQGLIDAQEANDSDEPEQPAERPAPVSAGERLGLMLVILGSVASIASLALTWGNDAGAVSHWARRADEALAGESFNGISASGGTIFGWIVLLAAGWALASAVRSLVTIPEAVSRSLLKAQGFLLAAIAAILVVVWFINAFIAGAGPNTGGFGPLPTIAFVLFAICAVFIAAEVFATGSPRMGADGALIAGIAMLVSALAYATIGKSSFVETYSNGPGVLLALAASAVVVIGGVMAVSAAPYGPFRPMRAEIAWGRILGASLALLLIVGSAIGVGNAERKSQWGWFFDGRLESLETPEFLAEVQALQDNAGDDISKQLAAAQDITNMYNALQTGDILVYSGFDAKGPNLGWLATGLAAVALLASFASAGVMGGGETRRWYGAVLMAGSGLGIMAVAGGFILSVVRVADSPNVLGGVGAFVTFVSGFIVFASGRSVVNEFRRRKLYRDLVIPDDDELLAVVGQQELQTA